jgi:hypothetical protein
VVPDRPRLGAVVRAVAAVLACAVLAAGCGLVSTTPPSPTPADFPGLAGILAQRGIRIAGVVSGDPGCDDRELAPTAIHFNVSGLDQTEPVPVYLYVFRNREAFDRRQADVDACAASYVTDPDTFASVAVSPFVLAGQGPWAPDFTRELRLGLTEAAGSGG